jgi:hypothetical protein
MKFNRVIDILELGNLPIVHTLRVQVKNTVPNVIVPGNLTLLTGSTLGPLLWIVNMILEERCMTTHLVVLANTMIIALKLEAVRTLITVHMIATPHTVPLLAEPVLLVYPV